jgi:hypothetical protein
MEKLSCVIRYLRGLESLWSGRGGRLSLLGVKLKDDRICISEENAFRIFGIRNFAEFWKVNSPITAYRVFRDNGEVFVEFEGDKGKVISYLFVGAFAYHLMRVRVVTDELEKIEAELSEEAAETTCTRKRLSKRDSGGSGGIRDTRRGRRRRRRRTAQKEKKKGICRQNTILKRWNRTPGVAKD